MVSGVPAAALGETVETAAHGQLLVGAAADLIVFEARRYDELLSRPQADRVVVRGGRAIDTRLPAYSELDDLVAELTVLKDVGLLERGATRVTAA
jgi:cytosine deaminase